MKRPFPCDVMQMRRIVPAYVRRIERRCCPRSWSVPRVVCLGVALTVALGAASATADGEETPTSPQSEKTHATGASAAEDNANEEKAAPASSDGDRNEADHVDAMCGHIIAAAKRFDVPQDFFVRLIWKESRLDPGAISPVGAQGIAQFMPETARIRGLVDPFEPETALLASAAFLADLAARFGSWGLAAAGYNGGPNRIPPFVAGNAGLPAETRDYVFSITGRTAETWARRAREEAAASRSETASGEATSEGPETRPAESPRRLSGMAALVERLDDARAVDGGLARQSGARPHGATVSAAAGDRMMDPRMRPVATILPGAAGALLAHAVSRGVPRPRPDVAPRGVDCPALVSRLRTRRAVAVPGAAVSGGSTPWGAQVAGHPERSVALRQYARRRARIPADLVARGPTIVVRRFAARGRRPINAVMFAADDRETAKRLCARIAAARVPCVVVRNR